MDSLAEHEIVALAKAFPPVRSAAIVLGQAGIPLEDLPNGEFMTPVEFWWEVSRAIDRGLVRDGRRALLAAAHSRMPYNDAFQPNERQILSVLVVGSSPSEAAQLRADRELRAILAAAKGSHLAVHSAPAAVATDLEQVLSQRPDVLHLACHGDGENLLFESESGQARLVRGDLIADVLGVYRSQAGIQLRGVVLNACHSADIAESFTSVADVVIAHHGPLDDACAVIFAGKLYQALVAAPSLAEAAAIAAGTAVLEHRRCVTLRENLCILGGAG